MIASVHLGGSGCPRRGVLEPVTTLVAALLMVLCRDVTSVAGVVEAYESSGRVHRSEEPTVWTTTDADILPGIPDREADLIVTSSNVFVDDLMTSEGRRSQLDAIVYVTATTQATDFYWDRDSGVRIHVGLDNVHLVPEYEDVNHSGRDDNEYTMNNPNNDEDKEEFQNVIDTFCRYPIPDKYIVTLEISRERTTATRSVLMSCDKMNKTTGDCSGQSATKKNVVYRKINEPCHRLGTFPDKLTSAANSFVCARRTDLLWGLFNQPATRRPRLIKFPPTKECRSARARCDQCLASAKMTMARGGQHPTGGGGGGSQHCASSSSATTYGGTQNTSEHRRLCCLVDCYQSIDCKLALSSSCTDVPVECAMGDAYRYTIQSVFNNLTDGVKCHVRHRPKEVLYELFYYVEIPNRDFRTTRTRHVVNSRYPVVAGRGGVEPDRLRRHDDLSFRSSAVIAVDYLIVEHNTGLTLNDEFILERHGKDTNANDGKLLGSVSSLPTGVDGNRRAIHPGSSTHVRSKPARSHMAATEFVVHEISAGAIYATSVTFDRPFEYSTSKWRSSTSSRQPRNDGEGDTDVDEDSTCSDKDIRKFRVADDTRPKSTEKKRTPTMLSGEASTPEAELDAAQTIEAVVQGRSGGSTETLSRQPFVYFLKSTNNSPYIRFTIPGNGSVLRRSFQAQGDNTVRLVKDESLDVASSQIDDGFLEIKISGRMTGCPSYLGLTIFPTINADMLLVHSDLVVFCPPVFNITARLRAPAPSTSFQDDADNRTMTSSVSLVVRFFESDDNSYDVQLTHFRLFNTEAIVAELTSPAGAVAIEGPTAETSLARTISLVVSASGALAAMFIIFYVGREVKRATRSTGNVVRLYSRHGNSLSAGKSKHTDERFLYVYHFGNNGGPTSGPASPSTSSRRHLSSTTTSPTSPAINAANGLRRYRTGSGVSCRAGIRGDGSSTVVIVYVVASVINCLSFLFTVLFSVVGLTISDDVRHIVEVIDQLQITRQANVWNLSTTIEQKQLDEFNHQRSLAVTQHERCTNRPKYNDELKLDVPTSVSGITNCNSCDRSSQSELLPEWASIADSYNEAVDDFSSTYWRRVEHTLRQSLAGYWRYIEDTAVPVLDCDDPDVCAWWLDFPRELFNATRRRLPPQLPISPDMESGTMLGYDISARKIRLDAVDFWTFLEVVSVESVSTWSTRLRQRYYRQLMALRLMRRLPSVTCPHVVSRSPNYDTIGYSDKPTLLERLNSTHYWTTTTTRVVNGASRSATDTGNRRKEVSRSRLSIGAVALSVDLKPLLVIFISLDVLLVIRRIVCTCDKYRHVFDQSTDAILSHRATRTQRSSAVPALFVPKADRNSNGDAFPMIKGPSPPLPPAWSNSCSRQSVCSDAAMAGCSTEITSPIAAEKSSRKLGAIASSWRGTGRKFFHANSKQTGSVRLRSSARVVLRLLAKMIGRSISLSLATNATVVLLTTVVLWIAIKLLLVGVDTMHAIVFSDELGVLVDLWVGNWTMYDISAQATTTSDDLCRAHVGLYWTTMSHFDGMIDACRTSPYCSINDLEHGQERLPTAATNISSLSACEVKPILPRMHQSHTLTAAMRDWHSTGVKSLCGVASVIILKTTAVVLTSLMTSLAGTVVLNCLEASAASARRVPELGINTDDQNDDTTDPGGDVTRVKINGVGQCPVTARVDRQKPQLSAPCTASDGDDADGYTENNVSSIGVSSGCTDAKSFLSPGDSSQLTSTRGRFMETHV